MLLFEGGSVVYGRGRPMHFGRILMSSDAGVISPHRHLLVRGCASPVRRAGVMVPLRGGQVGAFVPFTRLLGTQSSMLRGLGVRGQTGLEVGVTLPQLVGTPPSHLAPIVGGAAFNRRHRPSGLVRQAGAR
ncbi:MAG: hypothetical protein WBV80_25775 [Mycobacterium sp.]